MDFERLCMLFTMQEPFYGIILSSMIRTPSDRTRTMAVAASGNVFKLLYNEDFVKDLTIEQGLQVLKHECLHIAFNHFSIWETEAESQAIHDLRNIAEDMEINGYLDEANLPGSPVLAKNFNWPNELGTREYYSRLQKEMENWQDIINKLGFLNGKGDLVDDHSQWPTLTKEEAEQITQVVNDLLVAAAVEVEKNCGSVPGELKVKIDSLRAARPKPVADWRRYCRRYLGNEFSEIIRKSKKRESRRFPDAAGNRHRRKSHILVGIDTSGSISMPEYLEFFGQIATLRAAADFRVVECDAAIKFEYDYRGKPNMTVHGGGGTRFEPIIDKFIKERKKYDALVYFTDGYSCIPGNTPKDTLWVISSKGDQSDKNRYKVNGASVVFIPKKK